MMRATLLQGSLSGHVSIGGGSRRLHQRWRMQCGPRGKGGVPCGGAAATPAPVNRKSSFDDASMGRGPETRRAGQPRERAGDRTLAGRPVASTVGAQALAVLFGC
jgi:hypothetical protein